ncbi:MAG: RluA family pseudouridine synthase [Metamycoplasmataceae bacterium]
MKIELPIIINVDKKERIDKYIANNSDISRNDIQYIINNYGVFVDGMEIRKTNFIVFENQVITIKDKVSKEINIEPENIPLDIIFEDDDILVINKKSGMVVHPAPGHKNGTLVNALVYHFNNLSDVNGEIRPGIVHRIDKDTSGLLLIAKNNKSHNYFAELLKDHKINREYYALVDGIVNNNIIHINAPIGRDPFHRQKFAVVSQNSKPAISHIHVIQKYENSTLVRVELETGRTHQIRVHLAYIKHPIIGDELYNKKIDNFNQRLHAFKLSFIHINGKELTFEVDLPPNFFENTNTNH